MVPICELPGRWACIVVDQDIWRRTSLEYGLPTRWGRDVCQDVCDINTRLRAYLLSCLVQSLLVATVDDNLCPLTRQRRGTREPQPLGRGTDKCRAIFDT